MAIGFKNRESVSRSIVRMARDQIDGALVVLAVQPLTPRAVHDARKRFKRVRSLARLVRKHLGRKAFSRENRALRDAGRPLSPLRDAMVLMEVLGKLVEADPQPPAEWLAMRACLERRQEELCGSIACDEGPLPAIVESVARARERTRLWLDGPDAPRQDGWPLIHHGLKRAYREARRAFAAAAAEPTVERLHQWRKRVKDVWHQLQLLAATRPEVLKPTVRKMHRLADLLGDDHDLAVLEQAASDPCPACTARHGQGSSLEAIISRRRAQLQAEAWPLGHELFADRPRDYLVRLQMYFDAWQRTTDQVGCG